MTNEEKANIVVAQARKMLPMMKSRLGDSVDGYEEFFKKSLLNMAEWKDQKADLLAQIAYESGYDKARQEMKEYLEQNMTNYPDFMSGEDFYAFGMKEGYVVAFNKIINELFKEEQK